MRSTSSTVKVLAALTLLAFAAVVPSGASSILRTPAHVVVVVASTGSDDPVPS
jgi:hypothetical protein